MWCFSELACLLDIFLNHCLVLTLNYRFHRVKVALSARPHSARRSADNSVSTSHPALFTVLEGDAHTCLTREVHYRPVLLVLMTRIFAPLWGTLAHSPGQGLPNCFVS